MEYTETTNIIDYIFNSESKRYGTTYIAGPIAQGEECRIPTSVGIGNIYKHFILQTTHGQMLKTVKFKNGRIEFVAGAKRCDLYNDRFFDKIEIYDASETKIKGFKLNFKYFGMNQIVDANDIDCENGPLPILVESYSYPNNYKDRRLFLMKVDELDKNDSKISSYTFDYESPGGLPNRFSSEQDYLGFFNSNGQNYLLQTVVSMGPAPTYIIMNRNPSLLSTKKGVLTKITYPTGGSTVFDYELNKYRCSASETTIVTPKKTYQARGQNNGVFLDNIYINDRAAGATTLYFEVDRCVFGPNSNSLVGFVIKDFNDVTVFSGTEICNMLSSGTSFPLRLSNGNYKMYSYSVNPYPCNYTITLNQYVRTEITPASSCDYGGLRIKSISHLDNNLSIKEKYLYEYLTEGSILSVHGSFCNQYTTAVVPTCAVSVITLPEFEFVTDGVNIVNLSSNTNYPLGTNQDGYLLYEKIREKKVDGVNSDTLGYTVYYYNAGNYASGGSPTTYKGRTGYGHYADNYPFAPVQNNSWARGQLIKKEIYKRNSNQSYTCINSDTYYYSVHKNTTNIVNGFTAAYILNTSNDYPCNANGVRIPENDYIGYTPYKISTGYALLDSALSINISDNGSIENKIKYQYNTTNFLPSKETTFNSTKGNLSKTRKYSFDYLGIAPYDTMTRRNIVSPVIEEFIENNNKEVSRNRVYYGYMQASNIIIPDSIKSSLQGNALQKDVSFDHYLSYGNFLQTTEKGVLPVAYIWSYRHQYPIAIIKNATYSEVKTALGYTDSEIESLSNQKNPDVQWVSDQLREYFEGKDVMISTYTYKPLVGILSETDPSGRSILYEYDDFGRLIRAKDEEEKILQEYDYHYAQ